MTCIVSARAGRMASVAASAPTTRQGMDVLHIFSSPAAMVCPSGRPEQDAQPLPEPAGFPGVAQQMPPLAQCDRDGVVARSAALDAERQRLSVRSSSERAEQAVEYDQYGAVVLVQA